MRSHIPTERIERAIFIVRGHKVMLSTDLAELYGIEPRVLIQAVKRNRERFPRDFMFQLSSQEFEILKSQIVISSWGGLRRARPYAFTEHGALMAANVLNSRRAVEMSVYVIRAFVRIRQEMVADEVVARRLAEIEKTLLTHDAALRDLYANIRPLLLSPPEPKRRRMGFTAKEPAACYGESPRSA